MLFDLQPDTPFAQLELIFGGKEAMEHHKFPYI